MAHSSKFRQDGASEENSQRNGNDHSLQILIQTGVRPWQMNEKHELSYLDETAKKSKNSGDVHLTIYFDYLGRSSP